MTRVPDQPALERRLGTVDAVTIGLGSMVGAGIFVVLGPAAAAAGTGLLAGLAVAAVVAYCNATSSARLAALYPQSGGTYVYGTGTARPVLGLHRRLELRGRQDRVVRGDGADRRVLRVAAVRTRRRGRGRGGADGGQRTSACRSRRCSPASSSPWCWPCSPRSWSSSSAVGDVDRSRLAFGDDVSRRWVLQAAGLLFFAFAGYARIATLGEEVRDPARTIPRAIPIALGLALLVYAAVAVAVLAELGSDGTGFGDGTAGRRRVRGRASRARAGGPGRRRGGRARLAARADPRGLPHDAGDGARPVPAARAGRGASPVRQSAPRRDRGRRRRGRRSPRWSTCAARSASRRSRCWCTTPSRMRRR